MDDLRWRIFETEAHDLLLHVQLHRLHLAAGVVTEHAVHFMVLQGVAEAHDAQDLLGGLGLGILGTDGGGGEKKAAEGKAFHGGLG